MGDRRRIPTDNTIKENIFTLARELDRVREAWGSGIIVTSWYRPPNTTRLSSKPWLKLQGRREQGAGEKTENPSPYTLFH